MQVEHYSVRNAESGASDVYANATKARSKSAKKPAPVEKPKRKSLQERRENSAPTALWSAPARKSKSVAGLKSREKEEKEDDQIPKQQHKSSLFAAFPGTDVAKLDFWSLVVC